MNLFPCIFFHFKYFQHRPENGQTKLNRKNKDESEMRTKQLLQLEVFKCIIMKMTWVLMIPHANLQMHCPKRLESSKHGGIILRSIDVTNETRNAFANCDFILKICSKTGRIEIQFEKTASFHSNSSRDSHTSVKLQPYKPSACFLAARRFSATAKNYLKNVFDMIKTFSLNNSNLLY